MKIIFMGTPEFAVPCLDKLIDEGHEIIAVFTQPDKPKGRGKKLLPSPVKEKALAYGIPVFQPNNIKKLEVINQIESLFPECIVVVAYGQILPKKILELPPFGCINVHASLLPRYRGAAPINWSIIKGEVITGITTMYMDEGLDTGDMILKKTVTILDKTAGQLHDELSLVGAEALIETIALIGENKAPRQKQNEKESSYAPMINKSLGKINWGNPSNEIYNLIRGVNPWPTAYTTYKGTVLKVWEASMTGEECNQQPGQILRVNSQGIFVCTGKDVLLIQELQFPNGRRMAVGEYLKGNTIEANTILGE